METSEIVQNYEVVRKTPYPFCRPTTKEMGQQQQKTTLCVSPVRGEHDTRRYSGLWLADIGKKKMIGKNIVWSVGKFSWPKSTLHCLNTAVHPSVAADLVHRFMSTAVAISSSHVTEL